EWLPRQRWFGAKTQTIESIRVRTWAELRLGDATELDGRAATGATRIPPALFFFDVTYFNGDPDTYQIPLAISSGAEMDEVAMSQPQSVLTRLTTVSGPAVLHDGAASEKFRQELLLLIADNATIGLSGSRRIASGASSVSNESELDKDTDDDLAVAVPAGGGAAMPPAPLGAQPGEAAQPQRTDAANIQAAGGQRLQPGESPSVGDRLDATAAIAFPVELADQRLTSRIASAEQSNTSILYGDRFILKIYRRLQTGENPDVEIGRFLSDVAHFRQIPPFYGDISICTAALEKTTVAMLQGLVVNEGDGWQWFLDQLSNWLEGVADGRAPEDWPIPNWSSERRPIPEGLYGARTSLEAAELLGKRTAEMHLALSGHANGPAFAPEPMTREDLAGETARIEMQIKSALDALQQKIPALDEPTSEVAGLLLSLRPNLKARARALAELAAGGQRMRIHGDYHLGQTLRTGVRGGDMEATVASSAGDFVILDFEGEPARRLAERRRKQSPLKDVAGMMRSFSYVSFAALDRFVGDRNKGSQGTERSDAAGWAREWQNSASAMFLRAYRETIDAAPDLLPAAWESQELLSAYLLEKALYELLYELNNRPAWLRIPMEGILAMCRQGSAIGSTAQ
ncbi:MAG: alpha-amylase, partial [Terracidiphilus sp.]